MVRLVARHSPQPPRMPFVLLVLGVLGAGLVVLLLLNSASAADSFAQQRLQRQNTELVLRQEELGRQIAALEAPGALAAAAHKLGLVPSGDAGFLVLREDGSVQVVGSPVPATAPPPPPKPSPSTSASPTAARPGTSPTAGRPATSPSTQTSRSPLPTSGPHR